MVVCLECTEPGICETNGYCLIKQIDRRFDMQEWGEDKEDELRDWSSNVPEEINTDDEIDSELLKAVIRG